MLAPIYNAVNTVLTRWTSALATKLNTNCDATVSSRASGASYTIARAAKLDYLDIPVSSVLSRVSVQAGVVNTSTVTSGTAPDTFYVDVTIAAVNTSKTIVLLQGGAGVAAGSDQDAINAAFSPAYHDKYQDVYSKIARARLLNSTTLRVSCGATSTYKAFRVQWQVIEFS